MDEQNLIRNQIEAFFKKAKKRNSLYSLRALAKNLNVPASNLSAFMKGKRKFSPDTIEAIANKIIKNPEDRKDILGRMNELLIEKLKKNKSSTSDYSFQSLTEDEFLKLDEWYFYAIRSLLSLSTFKLDFKWIAERLNLSIEQVEQALQQMLNMGLIQITADNRVVKSSKHLKTPDTAIKNPEVVRVTRKIHEQSIQQALYSLHHHDVSLRDITWVNIPTNTAKIEKSRELIRKFQDDMLALLEDGNENEVYRLTVQFCPLSKQDNA